MDQGVALVLAATVPATITAGVTVGLARASRGMRDQVAETHKQVTVNGHSSDQPTVLDRLEEVKAAQTDLRAVVDSIAAEVADHVAHSSDDRRNLWRAVWYAYRATRDPHVVDEHIAPPEERQRQ